MAGLGRLDQFGQQRAGGDGDLVSLGYVAAGGVVDGGSRCWTSDPPHQTFIDCMP